MPEDVTVIGNEFLEPVVVDGYPRETLDDDGWQMIEKFRVVYDAGKAMVPRVGVTNAAGYVFRRAELQPVKAFPGVYEFTFTWGNYTNDGASWNGSDNRSNVTCNTQTTFAEKKIEDHPEWGNLTAEQQQILGKIYKTFTLVTITFRKRTLIHKSSFRFTEPVIVEGINSLSAPPEVEKATPGKWKKTEHEIHWSKGEYVELNEAWQYSADNWANSLEPFSDLAALAKKKKNENKGK